MWRRAFAGLPAAERRPARPRRLRPQRSLPLLRHRCPLRLCRRKNRRAVPRSRPRHHPGHVGHRPARQPQFAHRQGIRPLRPRQSRIHPRHSRSPLPRRPVPSLPAAPPGHLSRPGPQRVEHHHPEARRNRPRPPRQIRQHHLSSRAQSERMSRRPARLLTSPSGSPCSSISRRPRNGPASAAASSKARAATPKPPSISSPPPDVSSTSATAATTTRSTGNRRTKPPPAPSALKPAAPPTPLLDAHLLPPRPRHLSPRRAAHGAPARAGQLLPPVPPPPHAHRRHRLPPRPGPHRHSARRAVQ